MAGNEDELSFVWAGGQFTDHMGPTDQQWDSTLDGNADSTDAVTVPTGVFREGLDLSDNSLSVVIRLTLRLWPGALVPDLCRHS